MPKLESTPEGSNLLNRSPMKSKLSRPNFNNLSNLFPLDLTISNETTAVATTAKEDEEVTKATLAITVETTAVATILVAKARTTKIGEVDIPTTRISPVNCMEGDTIPTNASRSRSELANNSRHLAVSNNETTRTAITSPISPIDSLPPTSLACQPTTLRWLVQKLIHLLGSSILLPTRSSRHSRKGCAIIAASKMRLK